MYLKRRCLDPEGVTPRSSGLTEQRETLRFQPFARVPTPLRLMRSGERRDFGSLAGLFPLSARRIGAVNPGASAARPPQGYETRPSWGRRPDNIAVHRRLRRAHPVPADRVVSWFRADLAVVLGMSVTGGRGMRLSAGRTETCCRTDIFVHPCGKLRRATDEEVRRTTLPP